jgi:bacteriocin biosynthesis cyclodehydratase domain-containing protein
MIRAVGSTAQAPDQRPRLRRGLVVIPDGEALLVTGGPRRQRFTGAAAASVLAKLLPLADGSRTPGMLAAELGLPAVQVDQALGLMEQCELLEIVAAQQPEPSLAGHVRSYLARNLTWLGAPASSAELTAELAHAAVLIVAPGQLAGHLREDLSEMGIGTVLAVSAADQTAPADVQRVAAARRRAAVVLSRPGQDELPATLVMLGRTENLPVIRAGVCEHQIEIGPAFNCAGVACLDCFVRGRARLAEPSCPDCGQDQATPLSTALDGSMNLAAGLIAAHVLEVLSGAHRALRPRNLATIGVPDLSYELLDVLPEPGCAHCGMPPASDAAVYWPMVYEWQMATRNGPFETRAPVSAERVRRLNLLETERPTQPCLPRSGLPAPPPLGSEAPAAGPPGAMTTAAPIDAATLSGILSRVAGRRAAGRKDVSQDDHARWAPSGGNLASVGLYVAAQPNPFSLPGTVVKYDDLEHQAVSVRADHVPVTSIAACTDLGVDVETDALVIFVAAVARLRKKYADFSWRLSHLDAGCAALQLSLVAATYGLNVCHANAWNAELADLIGLDPDNEIVTAVGRLRPAGPDSEVRSPCR